MQADGTVEHYEGEAGSEHLVCLEWPDGTVTHHEGTKGSEHVVRIE